MGRKHVRLISNYFNSNYDHVYGMPGLEITVKHMGKILGVLLRSNNGDLEQVKMTHAVIREFYQYYVTIIDY